MAEQDQTQNESGVIKQLRDQVKQLTLERDAARLSLVRDYTEGAGFDPGDFMGQSVINGFGAADHDWSRDSFNQWMEANNVKAPTAATSDQPPPDPTPAPPVQNEALAAFNRLRQGSAPVDATGDQISQLEKAIAEAQPGSQESIALRQALAQTIKDAKGN